MNGLCVDEDMRMAAKIKIANKNKSKIKMAALCLRTNFNAKSLKIGEHAIRAAAKLLLTKFESIKRKISGAIIIA